MGNRAVIQLQTQDTEIYLHWNGGYDTVKPMLDMAREYELRPDDYGVARLCQIIGNTLGGTLSLGVTRKGTMDTEMLDNGVYVVDDYWNIVDRRGGGRLKEQQVHEYEVVIKEIKDANDKFFVGGAK